MSSSGVAPPSPGRLLRGSTSSTDSIALSDAVLGAFSFASISAAAFSAVTAPSASATAPCPSDTHHRYNTRLSTRHITARPADNSSAEEPQPENCILTKSHHRHALPLRTSHLLTTATANARLARVMRKSNETQKACDGISLPLLASTPSKSNQLDTSTPPALNDITNSDKSLGSLDKQSSQVSADSIIGSHSCYDFSDAGGWLTARANFVSSSSTVTVGSGTEVGENDDSVIIIDDDSSHDVFKFTGSNDTNDSVIIMSPMSQKRDENAVELVDEPQDLNDSICVTRHKIDRVCPITKLPFREPVRNVCGHVYEKSAILEMTASRWRRWKPSCPCPVSGCQSNVIYSKLMSY